MKVTYDLVRSVHESQYVVNDLTFDDVLQTATEGNILVIKLDRVYRIHTEIIEQLQVFAKSSNIIHMYVQYDHTAEDVIKMHLNILLKSPYVETFSLSVHSNDDEEMIIRSSFIVDAIGHHSVLTKLALFGTTMKVTGDIEELKNLTSIKEVYVYDT